MPKFKTKKWGKKNGGIVAEDVVNVFCPIHTADMTQLEWISETEGVSKRALIRYGVKLAIQAYHQHRSGKRVAKIPLKR